MPACYFFVFRLFSIKGKSGWRWQTTAAFSCATARVGSQKVSWSLQPTVESWGWGLSAAKFPESHLWLILLKLVSMSFQKGGGQKENNKCKEPSLLWPSSTQKCQSGWSRLISAQPRSSHCCHSCSTGVGGKLQPAQAGFILTHQQVSGELE